MKIAGLLRIFFNVLQKVTFGAERDFDLREGKQLSDMGYVGHFSE